MTTRKMTVSIPKSRPRNPFHEEVRGLRAGVHGSSRKAERQQHRQNLLRHMDDLLNEKITEFEID